MLTHTRLIALSAAFAISCASGLFAQDEMALRRAFEGSTVTLRIDMPGTSDGVTVSPGSPLPLDVQAYRGAIQSYGIAIRAGARAMVTRIKVKKSLIEFQLDGGGYGTFGDVLGSLSTNQQQSTTLVAQSPAEIEREHRAKGGSRFNLKYQGAVPADALTPEAVRTTLAKYVDFSAVPEPLATSGGGSTAGGAATNAASPDEGPPAAHAPMSAQSWTAHVGWGNQLFPSYVIATASVRPGGVLAGDAYTLGDPNGQVAIQLVVPEPNSNVSVTISSPGLLEAATADLVVPEAGRRYTIRPALAWDFSALAQVRQTRPAALTVRISVNGTPLPARVLSITLRSINDCPFLVQDEDGSGHVRMEPLWWMFAAYVNENHPLNDQIRREALDAGIVTAFKGYQGNAQEVMREVYAFWNVLQRRGVKYSNIVTTAAESQVVLAQQVRFVDQSVANAQANCVDGSVLFASLLRQVGIDPVLVLVPGHMFVGFYIDARHSQIAYLETTMMGSADPRSGGASLGMERTFGNDASYRSFVAAWNTGNAEFEQHRAELAQNMSAQLIDVGKARQAGILPIAFSQ